MVEKPSPNPVDPKPSALSENAAVQTPAPSSEIETGATSNNPSTVAELKPDTSTETATTSKSDTPKNPVGRISDIPPEILSETKPVLPENAADPVATIDNISGAKPDISSERPTDLDDIFVSPKTPSILISPSESPIDPEISNPSENPTDPEISSSSENTPLVPSVIEASQTQCAISSIENFLGCALKQIMYVFLFYTIIGMITAILIFPDSISKIAIPSLFVIIGIGSVLLLKSCYRMISQIIADYRSGKKLPSNTYIACTSNPSPPEILPKAEITESVVEAPVPVPGSRDPKPVDIKSSVKDKDAAQGVEEIVHSTRETIRLRHVGAENK